MKRILLAIGEPNYSKILRDRLKSYPHDFAVLDQEVLHHKYLFEILENEQPEILIVHDYYLQTDKETAADKEIEWLELIETLRTQFDDSVRVVFLCERNKGDAFLSELVNRNVLDIFNNNSINIHQMIEQLMGKPKYSNASKFKVATTYTNSNLQKQIEDDHEVVEDQVELSDETIEKETNPVIHKVVEKKIINKVINKQVVKKQLKFNVLHNVTKHVGYSLERKLILVGSPFQGTGSTFIAHLFAKIIADYEVGVSYVENPFRPAYSYDRFFGKENATDYISLFHAFRENDESIEQLIMNDHHLETSNRKSHTWEHEGVRLIAKHPEDEQNYTEKEIDFTVFAKLILSLQKTPIVIVDVGSDWNHGVFKELSDLADYYFLVLPPDISRTELLESETAHFKRIRTIIDNDKTYLIGNRFTPHINEKLFPHHKVIVVPSLSDDEMFKGQYSGEITFGNKQTRNQLLKSFSPLVKQVFPKEYLKMKRREDGFLKGLFNRSITITKET